ncbi:CBASS cGAMP synthase [Acidocella sp.]|uniref:CBASS cGAMP synthase n=1 Tax=Acidocella sp. TaxID=50710 RepID=UPI00262B3E5B|nr:CBASS cGAMP synthase [Acidocella sp.]
MGIAAGLFFRSNDREAQTLEKRISPSPEQFDLQKERWNELAEYLSVALKDKSGCQIRTWLQGSYKFGTQVRPPDKFEEFDIDLGIYYCWQGRAEKGQHAAQDLKAFSQEALKSYRENAEGVVEVVSPPKTRCSRIRYRGNFHIDIPSYHLDPSMDERTLASEQGWEVSDPKAIYVWFKDKFDDTVRAVARRQIKYLKCWAALRWKLDNGRPSSIVLTVLAAEALSQLSDVSASSDDETLTAMLKIIIVRLNKGANIRNPVNLGENLNRLTDQQWTAFVEGIEHFYGIAQDACSANSELEAADLWTKAFKHFFPMPNAGASALNETVIKSNALIVSDLPDVMITAVARKNPNRIFRGINKIGPIPKDCDLTFQIKNPLSLPVGTTVEWFVRNEGSEAEDQNDLGHEGATGNKATESSAYVGTHFMDCIFRNSGRAFAVRRIPVTVNGTYVPPRNPSKKPAYTRLVGRR